jgi:hypothetical protein
VVFASAAIAAVVMLRLWCRHYRAPRSDRSEEGARISLQHVLFPETRVKVRLSRDGSRVRRASFADQNVLGGPMTRALALSVTVAAELLFRVAPSALPAVPWRAVGDGAGDVASFFSMFLLRPRHWWLLCLALLAVASATLLFWCLDYPALRFGGVWLRRGRVLHRRSMAAVFPAPSLNDSSHDDPDGAAWGADGADSDGDGRAPGRGGGTGGGAPAGLALQLRSHGAAASVLPKPRVDAGGAHVLVRELRSSLQWRLLLAPGRLVSSSLLVPALFILLSVWICPSAVMETHIGTVHHVQSFTTTDCSGVFACLGFWHWCALLLSAVTCVLVTVLFATSRSPEHLAGPFFGLPCFPVLTVAARLVLAWSATVLSHFSLCGSLHVSLCANASLLLAALVWLWRHRASHALPRAAVVGIVVVHVAAVAASVAAVVVTRRHAHSMDPLCVGGGRECGDAFAAATLVYLVAACAVAAVYVCVVVCAARRVAPSAREPSPGAIASPLSPLPLQHSSLACVPTLTPHAMHTPFEHRASGDGDGDDNGDDDADSRFSFEAKADAAAATAPSSPRVGAGAADAASGTPLASDADVHSLPGADAGAARVTGGDSSSDTLVHAYAVGTRAMMGSGAMALSSSSSRSLWWHHEQRRLGGGVLSHSDVSRRTLRRVGPVSTHDLPPVDECETLCLSPYMRSGMAVATHSRAHAVQLLWHTDHVSRDGPSAGDGARDSDGDGDSDCDGHFGDTDAVTIDIGARESFVVPATRDVHVDHSDCASWPPSAAASSVYVGGVTATAAAGRHIQPGSRFDRAVRGLARDAAFGDEHDDSTAAVHDGGALVDSGVFTHTLSPSTAATPSWTLHTPRDV